MKAIAYLPNNLRDRWHQQQEARMQKNQLNLQQVLSDLNAADSLVELNSYWSSLSARWRHEPACAEAYIRNTLNFGGDVHAADVAEWQLGRKWESRFVHYYGLIPQNAEKRLQRIQDWVQARPRDVTVLLAGARLAMSADQWGKAEQWLQQSIEQQPTVSAYLELAATQQQLGKSEQAWRSYQAARQQARVDN